MDASGQVDQLSVLVIDDEPQVCELIASAFTRRGDVVVTASSAEEGLEQLPYFTFQVAFVDHHLPGMEGLVLGGYLRRNNPDMQIALITAETDPKLRDQSEGLGLRFIQKPFEIPQLMEVADDFLLLCADRERQRRQQTDPHHVPSFAEHHQDLGALFDLPGVPERIASRLAQRIKECLNHIASSARYTERDRVAALAGLLAARVLGVALPRRRDGTTLFARYDQIMRDQGRRTEFSD